MSKMLQPSLVCRLVHIVCCYIFWMYHTVSDVQVVNSAGGAEVSLCVNVLLLYRLVCFCGWFPSKGHSAASHIIIMCSTLTTF